MHPNQTWKQKNTRNPRKKQRKTQETTIQIPEEILELILVRLPIKTLIRCKSVCKTWRTLIQSDPFMALHRPFHADDYFHQLIISPSPSSRLITPSSPSPDFLEVVTGPLDDLALPSKLTQLDCHDEDSFLEWRTVVRTFGPLSGSRNNDFVDKDSGIGGVYCLIVNRQNKFGRSLVSLSKIALCNPATREFKLTNPFPMHIRSLLDEISRYPCRVHYGFGTFGLDYKIVVVVNWRARYKSFLSFVYSMRRGTWKKIVEFEDGKGARSKRKAVRGLMVNGIVRYPEISQDFELCPQRFFKGCWHWMASNEFQNRYNVLSFNVANNEFKRIVGPSGYYDHRRSQTLVVKGTPLVFNDCLGAIYVSQPRYSVESQPRTIKIDLWVMLEYGVKESWSHFHRIDLLVCQSVSRFVGMTMRPRYDYDEEERGSVVAMFFEDGNKQLVSCDVARFGDEGQLIDDDKGDEHGFREHGIYNISSSICWNILGLSTYNETFDCL